MVDLYISTAPCFSTGGAASEFHARRRSALHHPVWTERVDPRTGASARIQALRSHHPHVALTAHGSQLLAVARRSLEELDTAMSRIAQTARETGETLSVGAGLVHAANVFPAAIREFWSRRPNVRIQLFDADATGIVKQIQAGGLDIGFGFFKGAPGISRTRFFRFPLDGHPPRERHISSPRLNHMVGP